MQMLVDAINTGPDGELIWDLITSFRSLDMGLTINSRIELKTLTTERIRAVVGIDISMFIAPRTGRYTGGSYMPVVNFAALNAEQRARRDELLAKAPPHFRSHYQAAVDAIRILYRYNLKEEREVTDVANEKPV
jgi:hypothetical protein